MTLAPTDAIESIRAALRPGVERDVASYEIDGTTPAAAFEPATCDEVATLLRLARDAGLAVAPQGSRTALDLGRPLDAYDIALDTRGLRRTVEYVPDDLTVTVEAGRRLGALQAELAEHGQYVTIDAPPGDDVTIGGLLATARPGAWRGHLPAARDIILGMRVAMPDGTVTSSGGRVVKNVTGYDMQRMHTGALGAFGVVVEATFKVAPLPTASRTLVATAPTISAAVATAHRLWDASPALRALTVLTPDAAASLGMPSSPAILLELIGTPSAVDRSARDLNAAVALDEVPTETWQTLRQMHGGPPHEDQGDGHEASTDPVVVRAGVPPTAIGEMIEAVSSRGATSWAHLASGAVLGKLASGTAEEIVELRGVAEGYGGFLVVESAPRGLRAAVENLVGDATLVRALRDQFDLRRTINPGRWGATL